jgi:hypothetical protein
VSAGHDGANQLAIDLIGLGTFAEPSKHVFWPEQRSRLVDNYCECFNASDRASSLY